MSDTQSNLLLKGEIALITGCSGGIGQATALALARQGCSIAVHYNSAKDKADALVSCLEALGVTTVAFQADLSEYDAVRRLHKEVVDNMGHPTILFNNAGTTVKFIGPQGDIQSVSIEDFEQTWKTNTGSAFLLTQLSLPSMIAQKHGRIIFCSSVAAGTGGIVGPHYASSKSAMHGMLHWIAMRYAKDGVTCNAVAPALITDTTMMANLPPEEVAKRIPIGRMGNPDEIASIVLMLATNSYMTNKIIVADGGLAPSAF